MTHDPHFALKLDGKKIIVVPGPDKTIAQLFEYATKLKSDSPEARVMMETAKIAETRAGGDRTKLLRDVCDQEDAFVDGDRFNF
ncbi:MAG TPA: hypothetical protein VIE66_02565 [Methylocella sp.]|jgi:hypothetical protein